jgi:hypothetical protein
MAIAYLHNSASIYAELPYNNILIQKSDGETTLITGESFDHLYFRLDDEIAALKENCIEYTIVSYDLPVDRYPDWFVEAVQNNLIFIDEEAWFFDDPHKGETLMYDGGVMLRNFLGELRFMEYEQFDRYYSI